MKGLWYAAKEDATGLWFVMEITGEPFWKDGWRGVPAKVVQTGLDQETAEGLAAARRAELRGEVA